MRNGLSLAKMRAMRKSKNESDVVAEPMTGAPAALRRLETEELKCYLAKEGIEGRLGELEEPPLNVPNEIRDAWRLAKAGLEGDLLFAFKRWDVARKALMEYDKSVKAERREGEKVLVSEVKEWFAQMRLTTALACEQALLVSAQAAAVCNEAGEFAAGVGDDVRAAFDGAWAAAVRDGVIPEWGAA